MRNLLSVEGLYTPLRKLQTSIVVIVVCSMLFFSDALSQKVLNTLNMRMVQNTHQVRL